MAEINDVTTLTESIKRIAKAIDSESDTKSITDSLDAIADYIEENGIGGGGGDFTTANVTVINNDYYDTNMNAPFVIEGDEEFQIPPAISAIESFSQGETTCKVALYKGSCIFDTNGRPVTSVSGNAESIGEGGEVYAVIVKGDCTITTA